MFSSGFSITPQTNNGTLSGMSSESNIYRWKSYGDLPSGNSSEWHPGMSSNGTLPGMPSARNIDRRKSYGDPPSGNGSEWLPGRHPPVDNQRRYLLVRRQLLNLRLISQRNLCSVAIPTIFRELFRRGVVFNNIPEGRAAMAVGTGAVLLPSVLEFAGLVRDIRNGNSTRWRTGGRLVCAILPPVALIALIARGGMNSAAAAALASANFVYTPIRDFIQNYQRLGDDLQPGPEQRRRAQVLSGLAYGPNQGVINILMHYGSSWLEPSMGTLWANAVARAGVNFLGETADEFATLLFRSRLTGRGGQSTLNRRRPAENTWGEAMGRTLTNHAGRSALFAALFCGAFLVGTYSTSYPILVESLVIGFIAVILYIFYMFSLDEPDSSVEGDLELGSLRGDSSTDSASSDTVLRPFQRRGDN